MATTYSFGVSNTTASTATLAPIKLGLLTNYGKIIDEPTESRLTNSGSALLQDEYITYNCKRTIPKFNVPNYNPGPVKDGLLYSLDYQVILRETRDDGTVIDHPIRIKTSVMHDIAAPWTVVPGGGSSYVKQAFLRAISGFFHDDGTERFNDIAKSALVPTAD